MDASKAISEAKNETAGEGPSDGFKRNLNESQSDPSNIIGRSMSYLDVSNQNEDEPHTNEHLQDLYTGESVDKSQFDASMSKSPLFKISDLKNLKMKELHQAVREHKKGREDDPEHDEDKYLGKYQEHTKSARSNISKISKSKVDHSSTKAKQPNAIKSLKNI